MEDAGGVGRRGDGLGDRSHHRGVLVGNVGGSEGGVVVEVIGKGGALHVPTVFIYFIHHIDSPHKPRPLPEKRQSTPSTSKQFC
jgi:hypothetical protein